MQKKTHGEHVFKLNLFQIKNFGYVFRAFRRQTEC